MADGKHCPSCGTDIGVWPIFSAGLPNLIRCPQCRARLAYQRTGGFLAVVVLLSCVVIAVAYVLASFFPLKYHWFAFIVLVLGAWTPVELAVASYLRKNKVLELRSGGAPPTKLESKN